MILVYIFYASFSLAFIFSLTKLETLNNIGLCLLLPVTTIIWVIGTLYYYIRWSNNHEQWVPHTFIKKDIGGLFVAAIWMIIVFENNGDPTDGYMVKKKKEQ